MEVLEDGEYEAIAAQIVQTGFAFVRRSERIADIYERIFRSGANLFRKPVEEKAQLHAAIGRNLGYRPVGEEYSIDPSIPDIKETITYVPSELGTAVNHPADAHALYALMQSAVDALDPVCLGVMRALANRFSSNDAIYAAGDSQLALNYYPVARSPHEILIQPHEDGCLLTVLASTDSGLELRLRSGEFCPCDEVVEHLVLVAGVSLTIASGGAILPVFHRVVRRPRVSERLTIAYDATSDLHRTIPPWIAMDGEAVRYLDEEARLTLTRFGLPPLGH